MADFTDHFREIVVPRMREAAIRLSGEFAHDMGYADIVDEVMIVARRAGFSYLPEAKRDAMVEWVDRTVRKEVERVVSLQGKADSLARQLTNEPNQEAIHREVRRFLGFVGDTLDTLGPGLTPSRFEQRTRVLEASIEARATQLERDSARILRPGGGEPDSGRMAARQAQRLTHKETQ